MVVGKYLNMKDEIETMELSTLKATVKAAQETWPALTPRIRDGAVIVCRGLIREIDPQNHIKAWTVKNYTVTIANTKPPRWTCNCKHLGDISGDFLGHPGSICKHIAAAALFESGKIQLPQPQNLTELLDRLIAIQVIPHMPDINFTLSPTGIKLGYDLRLDGAVLKLAHKKSQPLIRRIHTGYDSQGDGIWQWQKLPEFQERYEEFKSICQK